MWDILSVIRWARGADLPLHPMPERYIQWFLLPFPFVHMHVYMTILFRGPVFFVVVFGFCARRASEMKDKTSLVDSVLPSVQRLRILWFWGFGVFLPVVLRE